MNAFRFPSQNVLVSNHLFMDEIVEITTILVRSAHTVNKCTQTQTQTRNQTRTLEWNVTNSNNNNKKIRCDMK